MGVCENFYRKLWLRSPDNVSPNNNKTKQQNRKASGKMSKQQTRGQVVAMYAPHRIPCPSNPREVQNNVRGTKTVQFLVLTASAPSAGTPVTVADVMGAVPGGLTYWAHVRVNLIRAWAPAVVYNTSSGSPSGDSVVLRVDCSNNDVNSPTVSWSDSGTGGQQRPRVAFELGLREQSSWFSVASTTELFRLFVIPATGNTNVIVQANVELLSPNLS
jgi:hypothetical protein